jgi:site-specific DNA-methyltransferase (adenine-specific)
LGLCGASVLGRMSTSFACQLFPIIRGNALQVLKQLPAKVDCVITSPPYYQQRIYGTSSCELGKEASVSEYVANLVDVFKAIPLEPWGSIWVNIGDKRGKHGELLSIPAQFCLAMNQAGFHLIDHVVWAKESVQVNGQSIGHCMIEPAPRRMNSNGHEPFYRFVVDPRQAWSDTCAVRVPRKNVADVRYLPEELMACHTSLEGRNLTNVWNVSTGQTTESHYAVFPAALIERPVAMTCPLEVTAEGPKRRIIEMVPYEESRPFSRGIGKYTKPEEETRAKSGRQDTGRPYIPRKPTTIGWEPDLPAIRRGIVLDPFCGTATCGKVALKLGRHFIGIELYDGYAEIAEDRCRQAHLLRSEFEAKNPIKASRPSFDEAPNDPMLDEVDYSLDFDAGVGWEVGLVQSR